MTLQAAIAEIEAETPGLSDEDMLAAVNAREVIANGLANSGEVLAYLGSIGKYTVIESIADDGANPLQNAAKVTLVTLKTREGFDFSLSAAMAMLQVYVSAGVLTQPEADTIVAMGQRTHKEFSGLRLIDIKRARA